jgi:hypothetical protein
MKEVFNLYLNSKQSLEGASVSTESLTFDLGSAHQNMPLLSQYANLSYCYVKLSYMAIGHNANNLSSFSTMLVEMNSPQPCGARTNTAGGGLVSSNIIGLMPLATGNTHFFVNRDDYENEFVKVANIFKGLVNIQLKDEEGQLLTLFASNNYEMLLRVYFDDTC